MACPSNDNRVECTGFAPPGAPIFLRRGKDSHNGKPVLLIHGGSASCDTFLVPRPHSLFDYLNVEQGFDVWLLDWSGSHYVTAANPTAANGTVDKVASFDIPKAIQYIRSIRENEGQTDKLAVVAHCMGSASLSMGIGAGYVKLDDVEKIVLSTIGLFYEMPWDGLTKLQDRILERVADANPGLETISPAVNPSHPWPEEFEQIYQLWPTTWGPPPGWDDDFLRRLAFLYGQAFLVSNLHPALDPARVRTQFGAVPFQFYRHGAQNCLRGFAAVVDAEGELPPDTPNDLIASRVANTYMNLWRFKGFKITLLTGAENSLWHRDAIDRMAEWLSRLSKVPTKHVLDGYGHQDLWWGKNSRRDVFPLVLRAIC